MAHTWRYRNWVMEAFHKDLPFGDFVRLHLAGDLIADEAEPDDKAEGIIATGYLAIARRFGHGSDKDMYLTLEDVIDNLGKNFLGLTLGCAHCHDHKYDPISAQDYYANRKFIAWYQDRSAPYNTSQTVYGDYLYTLYDRALMSRYDAKLGREIYDRTRLPPGSSFTASPFAFNGCLFCLSEDGTTYVMARA